jgi:hypothetical protein
MLEDQLAAIERRVRRECLQPDAGKRAEARAERLEAEFREYRAHVDTLLKLQDERADAMADMIDALARALLKRP